MGGFQQGGAAENWGWSGMASSSLNIDPKSELVSVLTSLEAHWTILEAELMEINRDMEQCEQCVRKYGDYFTPPLQYLKELKYMKKNKMKDIVKSMESFNANLQGGKRLVQSLERNMEPVTARPQPSPQAASLSQSQGRW